MVVEGAPKNLRIFGERSPDVTSGRRGHVAELARLASTNNASRGGQARTFTPLNNAHAAVVKLADSPHTI